MNSIQSCVESLSSILSDKHFAIDYFQREYEWEARNVEELLDDLVSEFLDSHAPFNTLEDVKAYGSYFMGSIVITSDQATPSIIDGQQRLTTLTLLLLFLRWELIRIGRPISMIDRLICEDHYGTPIFRISVPDRESCLAALYSGQQFDPHGASKSAMNIAARYEDISRLFPHEEVDDAALPYFAYWLMNRVEFVVIRASTQQDAHKIFISMNDRGVHLTPLEMLKSYLLSEIDDGQQREAMNAKWKHTINRLYEINENAPERLVISYFRGQYAESIRSGAKGAQKGDFDEIGASFHKWVIDNHSTLLGLKDSRDFVRFTERIMRFAGIYLSMIRPAVDSLRKETEFLYYNDRTNFAFSTQLLLATVTDDDSEDTIRTKLSLVSRFIDLYIVNRAMRNWSVNSNVIRSAIFGITKRIRHLDIPALKAALLDEFTRLNFDSSRINEFQLNRSNGLYAKHILARIMAFINESSDSPSRYDEYMPWWGKNPYEIEHIIANTYYAYKDEFDSEQSFQWWRNRFGNLLLLPASVNRSIKDKPYPEKLRAYTDAASKGTLYSSSLGTNVMESAEPRYRDFVVANGLRFKPYDRFGKQEIQERNDLAAQLIDLIWNPDMFL